MPKPLTKAELDVRQPKPLTKTELEFVLRAIGDAAHILAATSGMRMTEADLGEVLTRQNSSDPPTNDIIQALNLAQDLLRKGKTEQLDRQYGFQAAIEARGDPELLEAFNRWKAARNAQRGRSRRLPP